MSARNGAYFQRDETEEPTPPEPVAPVLAVNIILYGIKPADVSEVIRRLQESVGPDDKMILSVNYSSQNV